jgi:oxygen-independent coproporphyrinogen III oxidase
LSTGLYIHIPFCVKKCRYCDFYSCTDLDLIKPFTAELQQEMHSGDTLLNWQNIPAKPAYPTQLSKVSPECEAFDSLYIGGGTPSVLPADRVVEIIETAKTQFDLLPDSEITVEVNPDSVSRDWLQAVRDAGVNRVNIGVQSFNDDYLNWLGRIHSADQAIKAIEATRDTGFTNIGLDIIYGLAGQEQEQLKQDLAQALSFSPEHLSCYMLTYEPGTPLTLDLENRDFKKLPDQRASEFFMFVSELLQQDGYEHYEISNFARSPKARSRHNQKYWHRVPYIGLGPGAHSYNGAIRSWNRPDLGAYISAFTPDRPLKPEREALTREQHMTESLYLGLRLAGGIDISLFNREFDVDFEELFSAAIDIWASTGHLQISPANCALTLSGWLFHETIAADFAADL